MDDESDFPPSFICPISLRLFSDPVILGFSGQTFERIQIEAWLQHNNTNPLTNQRLLSEGDRTLIPNFNLRQSIDHYLQSIVGKSNAVAPPDLVVITPPALHILGPLVSGSNKWRKDWSLITALPDSKLLFYRKGDSLTQVYTITGNGNINARLLNHFDWPNWDIITALHSDLLVFFHKEARYCAIFRYVDNGNAIALHQSYHTENTWDIILPLCSGIVTLCYQKSLGKCAFYSSDKIGVSGSELMSHCYWLNWDIILPLFHHYMLFYRKEDNRCQIYEFNESTFALGAMIEDHTAWVGWDLIVPLQDIRAILFYSRGESSRTEIYKYAL